MISPEERLEELEKIFVELEDASETSAVIVEGLKDASALALLGVTKNVVTLSKGTSVFTFSEDVARRWKSAVVLTDWDRKGGHLARMLKEALVHNGVSVNEAIRARLAMLSMKDVKDIQSLPKFVNNLRAEIGAPRRPDTTNVGKRI